MRMRKTIYMLLAAIVLASCTTDDLGEVQGGRVYADDGEMPVRIGYSLFEGEKAEETRASIVGGEEYTGNYITDMWLLCFTQEGIIWTM